MEKEIFTCGMCRFRLVGDGCNRPLELECPYGKPISEVAETYKRKRTVQTKIS